MKTLFFVIISVLGLVGCEKTAEESQIINGTYTGTFERTSGMGSKESADVSITFNGNKFSGSSDKAKFPAICNGTYSIMGSQVVFTNSCVWTADFDWSLILSNDYFFSSSGDSIQIKRAYPGQMTDVYKLKKEQK